MKNYESLLVVLMGLLLLGGDVAASEVPSGKMEVRKAEVVEEDGSEKGASEEVDTSDYAEDDEEEDEKKPRVSEVTGELLYDPEQAKDQPFVSWADSYTLGEGDVLSFSVYGRPGLGRGEISIQPDGMITFLQTEVRATGLTVDELRSEIEKQLSKFYKNPRVIINPLLIKSKKYYVLGKVVDKGVFPMDRRTTLLEAVARSRGIETGLFEQNTVELADLPRSFVMRNGKRLDIDMEALFLKGHLQHNIDLEPGDYIYFASANVNEVYVLGAVVEPSMMGFTPRMTVMSAIASRKGFTRTAYREKVLVVRGSLDKPERIVVNTNNILKGIEPDFRLKPKDIIYISERPWRYAEELLDSAVTTFIQSAISSWTGANIPNLIQKSVLPQINEQKQQ